MEDRLDALFMCSPFKQVVASTLSEIKEEYDLKKVDIEVLYFLSVCGDRNTPTDVYKRLLLNKGHISQAIDSLTKHGFITAEIDENDKRCTHYNVTPESSVITERVRDLNKAMKKQLLKDISEDELTVFRTVLDKMYRNISD